MDGRLRAGPRPRRTRGKALKSFQFTSVELAHSASPRLQRPSHWRVCWRDVDPSAESWRAGGPSTARVRVRLPPMSRTELASLDEMMARLERALAASPPDSTEIVWIEARRTQVTAGRGRRDQARAAGPGGRAPCERNLLVRVRQSGRTGLHRTGGVEPSELENAVRDAVAQARLAPPTPAEPLAGAGERRGAAAATVATAGAAAGRAGRGG